MRGYGLITNAAEDMRDPGKTLPKALYLSVLITMTIYLLVSITVIGNFTIPEIARARDYALAEAAKPFLGNLGFTIMAVATIFSTSSAITLNPACPLNKCLPNFLLHNYETMIRHTYIMSNKSSTMYIFIVFPIYSC